MPLAAKKESLAMIVRLLIVLATAVLLLTNKLRAVRMQSAVQFIFLLL
jgi:hypothetical protein